VWQKGTVDKLVGLTPEEDDLRYREEDPQHCCSHVELRSWQTDVRDTITDGYTNPTHPRGDDDRHTQ
jgi:hypothetical protein